MKTTMSMTRLPGVAVVLVIAAAAAAAAAPLPALVLERTQPTAGMPRTELFLHRVKELDDGRLSRTSRVMDFTLNSPPGLYYTRVKLGNPPKEYSLQLDTSSDIMWVSCTPCNGCPKSSELNITDFYDPNTSSTCTRISCNDDICFRALTQAGHANCSTKDDPCDYNLIYGDGSATSGHYVSDTIYLDTLMGNQRTAGSSVSIFFGCSNSQSGNESIDGILGFGQNALSIISQLHSQGVSSKAFSHCLKGSEEGGGILILGEVREPGLVFTPLDMSQSHYNLNMKSIYVNGQEVPINSSLFTTSESQGTFVDPGTTLAYFADGVYDPVMSSINAAIHPSVDTFVSHYGEQCFISHNRSLFPTVTFYFEDEAAMKVGPENYLFLQGYYENNNSIFCMGFQRSHMIKSFPQTTILGDLVLHDKLFVFDFEKMRVGWMDRNCSLIKTTSSPVVVSGSLGRRTPLYYSGLVAIGVAVVNSWIAIGGVVQSRIVVVTVF